MAIKRDALDAIFSDLVRQRANFVCERCERDMSHDTKNAHCCHIFGRRITRLRHEPNNCLMLCSRCHEYMGLRPVEWGVFVRQQLGDAVVDELQRLANESCKFPKGWKVEARKHYRQEMERLKAARAENYTQRFEFVGFW